MNESGPNPRVSNSSRKSTAPSLTASGETNGVTLLGEGDALITDQPGVALGIRVADCVPIYLLDRIHRCAALVHAGREGTRLQIARNTVGALKEVYGATPQSLHAFIGPSAGPCCYEVDADTVAACADSGMTTAERMIDLWTSNRNQLIAAGVPAANIDAAGVCTICTRAFHSYRRDGTMRRNLALLML